MKTTRRGYVLIEMVLVISMLTILLGLCVTLIHALLKLDRVGRAHLNETSARARLARQFRQDVRAATRSNPGRTDATAATADRLELARPGGPTVSYQREEGRLVRIVRVKDQPPRRETFTLSPRGAPRFQVRDEGGHVFVSLIASDMRTPADEGPRREFRIDAALGRDQRWAASKESEQ